MVISWELGFSGSWAVFSTGAGDSEPSVINLYCYCCRCGCCDYVLMVIVREFPADGGEDKG